MHYATVVATLITELCSLPEATRSTVMDLVVHVCRIESKGQLGTKWSSVICLVATVLQQCATVCNSVQQCATGDPCCIGHAGYVAFNRDLVALGMVVGFFDSDYKSTCHTHCCSNAICNKIQQGLTAMTFTVQF